MTVNLQIKFRATSLLAKALNQVKKEYCQFQRRPSKIRIKRPRRQNETWLKIMYLRLQSPEIKQTKLSFLNCFPRPTEIVEVRTLSLLQSRNLARNTLLHKTFQFYRETRRHYFQFSVPFLAFFVIPFLKNCRYTRVSWGLPLWLSVAALQMNTPR